MRANRKPPQAGLGRGPRVGHPWRRGVLFAIALGAILRCQQAPSLRERLLELSGRCRPTPGRLAGETVFRPWIDARPGRQAEQSRMAGAPRQGLRDLERAVHARVATDPEGGLPDLALLHLVSGKTSLAIAGFELAARRPATMVLALTDLAAAYQARFEAEGDPLDLLRAVQAVDRGLSLAPSSAALLFNRAQTLTRLGTRNLAEGAWRELRVQQDSPGWEAEAALKLRSLKLQTDEQRWRRSLPDLRSPAATETQIASVVESNPAQARAYAEEVLLPGWADAASRGKDLESARTLILAAKIAQVLDRSRGEGLLADAIASIRTEMGAQGSPGRRCALLRGLRDFGSGVAQYNEQNLASARGPLTRAARDLAAAGNPLSFWARFYLAIDEYYGDADRGLALLDALLREIPCDRFPDLAGRCEWIAGTADKIQGRIQSSIRRYERAASALRRSGGEGAAAFVEVLLAESYSLLGQHSLGWQSRLLAFRSVPLAEGLRRNIAMWTEAREALLRQGDVGLARPLVEEAVAVAERWGRPLGLATAYLARLGYRLEIGARDAAIADLRLAERAVAQMEESPLKGQMANLVLINQGLCAARSDPARAASLLRRGLANQRSTGNRFDAIDYTTAMASAELAAGAVRAGSASLEEAIAIFEQVRSTVEDPVSRMQAFRRAQPAFDTLIRLTTSDAAGDPEAPFSLAERSRARVLLELRARDGMAPARREGFATLAELARMLPAGVALVSYAALEDEVLAWVVEDGHARLVTLKTGREALAGAIDRLRLEVTRRAPEAAVQAAAAPLYELLVRPLHLADQGAGSLIVVPDRWLARLPFAALFDRRTGRYLIEQRAVTMVPSATLLVRGFQAPRRPRRRELSVLAVGVPRSGSFSGRFLPPLPSAAEEARQVASLYEQAELLLGAQASKENFLRLSVSTDVMHFAGHAVIDLESPRRSVLLFAGRSGELEPLTLGELFAAGLFQSNLVVLSACRAQDGLADDREGVLGLAGAFFAAGVPEVVASPWDVDDRAAAPLMIAFHQEYRKHRSAGAAFRQAVLGLLRSRSTEARSPASWGGFTIIAGILDQEVMYGEGNEH
jgi:CHAT domain-containing protein